MTANWKAFLLENESSSMGKAIPADGVMLSDLSDRGLIAVHGEEAESFLQNQLSNDIHRVSETTHQASAWCNPKGRIIANFTIFKRGERYFLSLSRDLVEHVLKKLGMYIMMSKVTLEDASDTMAHFGVSGEHAGELLANALGNTDLALPSETDQLISAGDDNSFSILRIPGTVPRYEVFTDQIDAAKTLWNTLKRSATPVNSDGWLYQDILAGLPLITQASSEAWIPQMVNFIAINGVDFKKGCYPGQEVVARLNYLGKTKRRMYHVLIDTATRPEINAPLASDTDKAAGKILNAVINPQGKAEALAILKISEAQKELSLIDATDEGKDEDHKASVTLLDLPYSLDE